jgi:hypothetical protein
LQESEAVKDANWALSVWASSPFCFKKSEESARMRVGAALTAGEAVRARASRKKVLKDMSSV